MEEQTLVIIKPDGVARGLVGRIIQRFEDRNLVITQMRHAFMTEALAREHYAHLVNKPFFPEILAYMTPEPVIYMALSGENAVAVVRQMVGYTDPLEALPGTIRGDFAIKKGENVVHASDTPTAADQEILRFFPISQSVDL